MLSAEMLVILGGRVVLTHVAEAVWSRMKDRNEAPLVCRYAPKWG